MKKLYLILLMLLIMFIPTSHAVAVYQLDQPVSELNGYTLREVFEYGNRINDYNLTNINEWILSGGTPLKEYYLNGIKFTRNAPFGVPYVANALYKDYNSNNKYYTIINMQSNILASPLSITTFDSVVPTQQVLSSTSVIDLSMKSFIFTPTQSGTSRVSYFLSNALIDEPTYVYIDFVYEIDLTSFGIDNLTVDQMDKYYNLYLEAVRFEQENIEAGQDPGGYQNIFKSIINGVKGLMESMGDLWQFLNAPIITSDMQDYSFSVDWSWDLIGVVRQLISNLARLILQTNFIFINVLLSFTGIPIEVSLLTLLFSNFVFVILGWIIVKSFII